MSGYVLRSLKTVAGITAQNGNLRTQLARCRLTSMAGSSVSSSDSNKLKVEHDIDGREFYIKLTDKGDEDSIAVLQYSYIDKDYVDLEHTVVPQAFRGHGIAKVLAQTVFDHFVQKGTYIRPTCTYLQKFYSENPLPQYKEKVKWD